MAYQNNGISEEIIHQSVEASFRKEADPILAQLDRLCALLIDRNNNPSTCNSESAGNGICESKRDSQVFCYETEQLSAKNTCVFEKTLAREKN